MFKKGYLVVLSVAVFFFLLVSMFHNTVTKAQTPLGVIGLPAYDSGWVYLPTGTITFSHNLNTNEVLVYFIGKNGDGINQEDYGRNSFWYNLTVNKITVYSSDWQHWTYVRVMMWKIEEPPPVIEVAGMELLMFLGLGCAIIYQVYSKVKTRIHRRNNANQRALLEYTYQAR